MEGGDLVLCRAAVARLLGEAAPTASIVAKPGRLTPDARRRLRKLRERLPPPRDSDTILWARRLLAEYSMDTYFAAVGQRVGEVRGVLEALEGGAAYMYTGAAPADAVPVEGGALSAIRRYGAGKPVAATPELARALAEYEEEIFFQIRGVYALVVPKFGLPGIVKNASGPTIKRMIGGGDYDRDYVVAARMMLQAGGLPVAIQLSSPGSAALRRMVRGKKAEETKAPPPPRRPDTGKALARDAGAAYRLAAEEEMNAARAAARAEAQREEEARRKKAVSDATALLKDRLAKLKAEATAAGDRCVAGTRFDGVACVPVVEGAADAAATRQAQVRVAMDKSHLPRHKDYTRRQVLVAMRKEIGCGVPQGTTVEERNKACRAKLVALMENQPKYYQMEPTEAALAYLFDANSTPSETGRVFWTDWLDRRAQENEVTKVAAMATKKHDTAVAAAEQAITKSEESANALAATMKTITPPEHDDDDDDDDDDDNDDGGDDGDKVDKVDEVDGSNDDASGASTQPARARRIGQDPTRTIEAAIEALKEAEKADDDVVAALAAIPRPPDPPRSFTYGMASDFRSRMLSLTPLPKRKAATLILEARRAIGEAIVSLPDEDAREEVAIVDIDGLKKQLEDAETARVSPKQQKLVDGLYAGAAAQKARLLKLLGGGGKEQLEAAIREANLRRRKEAFLARFTDAMQVVLNGVDGKERAKAIMILDALQTIVYTVNQWPNTKNFSVDGIDEKRNEVNTEFVESKKNPWSAGMGVKEWIEIGGRLVFSENPKEKELKWIDTNKDDDDVQAQYVQLQKKANEEAKGEVDKTAGLPKEVLLGKDEEMNKLKAVLDEIEKRFAPIEVMIPDLHVEDASATRAACEPHGALYDSYVNHIFRSTDGDVVQAIQDLGNACSGDYEHHPYRKALNAMKRYEFSATDLKGIIDWENLPTDDRVAWAEWLLKSPGIPLFKFVQTKLQQYSPTMSQSDNNVMIQDRSIGTLEEVVKKLDEGAPAGYAYGSFVLGKDVKEAQQSYQTFYDKFLDETDLEPDNHVHVAQGKLERMNKLEQFLNT